MRHTEPRTIERLDYRPSPWQIRRVKLHFRLDPTATEVRSELQIVHVGEGAVPAQPVETPVSSASADIASDGAASDDTASDGAASDDTASDDVANDAVAAAVAPLKLDGANLETLYVEVDGAAMPASRMTESATVLELRELPAECTLTITTRINPEANTALEGLYRSSGNYCTQCEAEGFRKITWYLDRPDILALFDVSIEADPGECPVMLSNGNLVSHETLENGRALVHWTDPFPKPSYLFALVAGDLAVIEDEFRTRSGRDVLLQIYVQAHNLSRCDFAMRSLQAAMRWDEEVYGFEYDLDRFMIVAVDDFNMGAMENKGLNVFNSRYVLADAESATDSDFLGIESVVAHEYFHNWTGNRITCRDWFQLSLKEGLTVFRDQCFSADLNSATVKRIQDVRLLRNRQFPEDASPMAHPIRPDSYMEINNFYTVTVYEKGAEVIRMLHTLLGEEAWQRGMALYVERHDGEATTCDAFVDCMQAVTDVDLEQFRLWYSTAGTPTVGVLEYYDPDTRTLSLEVRQSIAPTPGQIEKPALHIPLVVALLDETGADMPLEIGRQVAHGTLLDLCKERQMFVFENLPSRPLVSFLRNFSAPVRLVYEVDNATLANLLARDSDGFNRWDAGMRLAGRVVFETLDERSEAEDSLAALLDAIQAVLADVERDPAFSAELMTLPSFDSLADSLQAVDVQALQRVRRQLAAAIATRFQSELESLVLSGDSSVAEGDAVASASPEGSAALDGEARDRAMGRRRLAGAAMRLLVALPEDRWRDTARAAWDRADNMTDTIQALTMLCQGSESLRRSALDAFLARWSDNRLVVDKWFAVQAASERDDVIEDVEALLAHPAFDIGNPNRVRSLIGVFAAGNPTGFHERSGRGYRLLADQVLALDERNPQTAAGLLAPLCRWQRFAEPHASLMHAELERIIGREGLSGDVYELVSKSLDQS